jgi:hypothetical protein
MRYIEARLDAFKRDEMYRIFISETLRIAPEGKHITKTWSEFINKTEQEPVDAKEIINEVMLNAGLSFGRE